MGNGFRVVDKTNDGHVEIYTIPVVKVTPEGQVEEAKGPDNKTMYVQTGTTAEGKPMFATDICMQGKLLDPGWRFIAGIWLTPVLKKGMHKLDRDISEWHATPHEQGSNKTTETCISERVAPIDGWENWSNDYVDINGNRITNYDAPDSEDQELVLQLAARAHLQNWDDAEIANISGEVFADFIAAANTDAARLDPRVQKYLTAIARNYEESYTKKASSHADVVHFGYAVLNNLTNVRFIAGEGERGETEVALLTEEEMMHVLLGEDEKGGLRGTTELNLKFAHTLFSYFLIQETKKARRDGANKAELVTRMDEALKHFQKGYLPLVQVGDVPGSELKRYFLAGLVNQEYWKLKGEIDRLPNDPDPAAEAAKKAAEEKAAADKKAADEAEAARRAEEDRKAKERADADARAAETKRKRDRATAGGREGGSTVIRRDPPPSTGGGEEYEKLGDAWDGRQKK